MGRPSKWVDRCTVCQRMKKDREFRDACMGSTYFVPDGVETLLQVNSRFGQPFKMVTLYRHMTKHQGEDILVAEEVARQRGLVSKNWQRAGIHKPKPLQELENTISVVEGPMTPKHEQALDAFIERGKAQLDLGQMNISAANYVQAIKVKADIDMRTKDRKLDMLKSMFAGAAPKQNAES